MDIIKKAIISAEATIKQSHYRTEIKVNDHVIITDEPMAVGGADEAANPQDLLLASIGGCTAITLRMYIDRKMWAVDEITVGVDMFKEPDGSTLIELRLTFKGDLSVEQKERLVQIANACPIHKMLTGKITIETGLQQA